MGLQDEILVDKLGCKKSEISTELFEWETQGIGARKSILHSSPVLYVSLLIFLIEEINECRNLLLGIQIKSKLQQ